MGTVTGKTLAQCDELLEEAGGYCIILSEPKWERNLGFSEGTVRRLCKVMVAQGRLEIGREWCDYRPGVDRRQPVAGGRYVTCFRKPTDEE